MKTKKINNLIKKVRNELDWPIMEEPKPVPVIRIVSDPRSQSHVIQIPTDPKVHTSGLGYLHELGHATLCEQAHQVFAANSYFIEGTEKEQFIVLAPALQAASDWFVNNWLLVTCPGEFKVQVKEELATAEKVCMQQRPPAVDLFIEAALTIALSIKCLDARIDCGGILKKAVDAFISVKADKPTADALVLLVNRLMSVYTTMRARLVNDGEYAAWEVFREEGEAVIMNKESLE